ncbi:MAG: preprotein translocase subunit SecE [Acidobacteria bacterium]|nr:preprotein translocase subunit SecE [Acidobacteriota bacterium]TDI52342.1 MAG: preprotein translocase subunit SecE [Acidobacteriota bacterium]
MNREMRRLQEREERRKKKQEESGGKTQRKAAAMQSKAPVAKERKSFFRRLRDYLHEVRQELRKVTWPTRDQMIAFTTVTVITSAVLTAVIFGLDVAAKQFVLWLVELRSQ